MTKEEMVALDKYYSKKILLSMYDWKEVLLAKILYFVTHGKWLKLQYPKLGN